MRKIIIILILVTFSLTAFCPFFDSAGAHGSMRSSINTQSEIPHFGYERTIMESSFNIYDIDFSKSGKTFAACYSFINIMDPTTWELEADVYHKDWTYELDYSPDESLLAIASYKHFHLYRTSNLSIYKSFFDAHDNVIGDVNFSPDGRYLATGSDDGSFKIWDSKNDWIMVQNISLKVGSGLTWVKRVLYSPDGDFFISAVHTGSGAITVWDPVGWKELEKINGYNDFYATEEFTPDGDYFVSSKDSEIYLWETRTWTLVKTLEDNGNQITAIDFSPKGDYMVSAVDNTITIWDTSSWTQVQVLKDVHSDVIRCLACSPNDYTFVSGSWDKSKIVWSTDTDYDETSDKVDAFPNDIAASKDSDLDGVPDEWNPGKDQSDSTTGLYLDAFPYDNTASLDSDDDGYPDAWHHGMNKSDSLKGLKLDAFPDDSAAGLDSDGDGYPDCWVYGRSEEDSTTGLKLDAFPEDPTEWADSDDDGVGDNSDAFPNDPAASIDTDGDGCPDSWNMGKSEEDSTTRLKLDAFPIDPAASMDTDGDEYPDNWNLGKIQADSTSEPQLEIDKFPDNKYEYMDTDDDGLGNTNDTDDDNDEYLDSWEEYLGTDPLDPSSNPIDTDNDGKPDGDRTNSRIWMDTDDDNDESSDETELSEGTDPLDASSKPYSINSLDDGFNMFIWIIFVLMIVIVLLIIFVLVRSKQSANEFSSHLDNRPTITKPLHSTYSQQGYQNYQRPVFHENSGHPPAPSFQDSTYGTPDQIIDQKPYQPHFYNQPQNQTSEHFNNQNRPMAAQQPQTTVSKPPPGYHSYDYQPQPQPRTQQMVRQNVIPTYQEPYQHPQQVQQPQGQNICPTCGHKMNYIYEKNRYFCYRCWK
jgi:WD40 repeat protein